MEIERNDCTVRAIAGAFDLSYEDAHEICKKYGRKDGQGFHIQAKLMSHLSKLYKIEVLDWAFDKRVRDVAFYQSTCLVIVPGHIFCVKNGKNLDLINSSESKIIRLYKVGMRLCGNGLDTN